MKRKPLLLTVALLLLVASGYYVYTQFIKSQPVNVWSLIPNQAVAVFETGECDECIDHISTTSFWELLKPIASNKSEDSVFQHLSKLFNPKSQGMISIHLTQKDDFDYIFYVSAKKLKDADFIKWFGSQALVREYDGVQLYDLHRKGKSFSWAIIEEIWVGSFTPFLIEDVVRTYRVRSESIQNHLNDSRRLPFIKNDAGNLYINFQKISSFLSVFKDKNLSEIPIAETALLDIKQRENSISFTGFTLINPDSNSLLRNFVTQTPVPFSIKNYISNRTVIATCYGFDSGTDLYKSLGINKPVTDSLLKLGKFDFDQLYQSLGKEIAVAQMESRSGSVSRLLLFNTKETKPWRYFFDQLALVSERGDSVYVESYSSYEIRLVEIKNLPEKLLKPLVTGFERSYYTHIGNTFIISETVEDLRLVLEDIDREEVWGKSVAFNQFLDATLLESNVSYYINTPRAIGLFSRQFNSKWQAFYASKRNELNNVLGFSAIQFSHLNESFYTNFTWTYRDKGQTQKQSETASRILVNLDRPIAMGPFVIRNHATKKDEFVVQDSTGRLHYLSSEGKIQWSRAIDGSITDKLYQLDYLNNNKLQLFFLANNTFQIIDRLGNTVAPYPINLNQQGIETISLIDYDNSKRYRFLLSDRSGRLWLFDKEGKNLDGWKPRSVDGPLAMRPDHHRIRGKDFILAIRKDGWMYLMNRRGENMSGFPLNLDIRPSGDYFVEPGNSMATTSIVVVSRDGVKLKVSAEGKNVSREPLIKAAIDDRFALVREHHGKSYIFSRQNSRQLVILSEDGKLILSNEYIGNNEVFIKYYDFGFDRSYYLVMDRDQDLCYVYNSQGRLVTPRPYSGQDFALKQEGDNIVIAGANGSTLFIQQLEP